MKWKFWIQEKLYCTGQEVTILLSAMAIIVLAHGLQIYRAGRLPFDDAYYAETDSLFLQLAARADSLEAVDTLFSSPRYGNMVVGQGPSGQSVQTVAMSSRRNASDLEPILAEITRWIVRDTLEKPAVSFPINIQTATERELQALPRIGPQMAKRILEFRKIRPFTSIEELLEVRGIGPKTMDQLRSLVTLMDSSSVNRSNPDSLKLEVDPG